RGGPLGDGEVKTVVAGGVDRAPLVGGDNGVPHVCPPVTVYHLTAAGEGGRAAVPNQGAARRAEAPGPSPGPGEVDRPAGIALRPAIGVGHGLRARARLVALFPYTTLFRSRGGPLGDGEVKTVVAGGVDRAPLVGG